MSSTTLSDRESLGTVAAGAGSLLGPSHGDLVLRMTNGPHAGRVVRLSSAKCSIGSAADCTLRLRGAGLDPVHCVILRGARQTIVRRWSGDTRLNDRRFDDMPLHHGDRLTVGPIEMQVMALPGEVRETAQAARRLDVELSAATGRIEKLTGRLDLANRQSRRRLRAVLAKLRKYQLRLTEVEGRRSRLTQEQETLNSERAQLQAAHEIVERRRVELEKQARRITECEATLTANRTEFERRANALLERETELTGRGRELTDRTAAMTAAQARLQTAQAEWEKRHATDESEARRLATLEAELTAQRTELQRTGTLLQTQETDLAQREKLLNKRTQQLFDDEMALMGREVALSEQIEGLRKQAEELTRHETEVAARCEALKNHWTVLTERETKLERDRAALVERERDLSERPTATQVEQSGEKVIEKIVEKTVVDAEAVARADKLQRSLDAARAELTAMQAEQARREAKLQADQNELATKFAAERATWSDANAAEKLELADRRAAVEAEAADVTARRATVELAARTVERWSSLVEEWSAVEPTSAVAPVAAEPPMSVAAPAADETRRAEMAAALEQAEHQLLDDRLQIEKLNAQLKTWRDEAELWKSRFDEQSFATPPAVAPAVEAAETSTDMHTEATASSIKHEVVADEPTAEETATAEVEPVSTPEVDAEAQTESEEAVAEAEAEEIAAEDAPAHEHQSESAADVLRRMGLTAALDEESAALQQPARPTPPPPPPAPKPVAAESHHEGEEALDTYMQQLFQRLGVNQGKQPAPEARPQPVAPVARAQVEEAPQAEQPAAPAVSLPPLQASEFKARSSAAERRSDLSALRELANFQAKTAITKHQINRKASISKGKQTIALLSLGMGLYCGYACFVQGYGYALYGTIAGFGIATLHLLQSIWLKRSAKKSARSLDDVIQKTAERTTTKEVGAQ